MWVYTLLPKILNMSLTAGIVTIFVLLARILLKKAPKIFSYALWAVVLFRLVCPVSFSSEFSLLGIFNAPAATNGSVTYIPADIVHTEYPQVNLPLPMISEAINGSLPQGEEQLAADPLEGLMAIATLLWLFGIAAMLIYSAVSLLQLRRRLIGAVCLRENIYLADHIAAPFVIGVIRPKIFLPSVLAEQEQRYIILHEQTHIRRFDHIFKMIAFLALAVHWFNPLVWVAFVLCVKDMEMSCDERVLKEMGGEIKGAYSTSLLSLATGRRLINGSPLAFGEGNIKERIKNVMNFKKPAAWVIAISVVLVAGLSVGFAANKANDGAGNYDFENFSVNGFMLGADTNKIDTSLLTPTEPLNIKDGYDFNFEEIRYSADKRTGRLRKLFINVYEGALIPSVTVNKGGEPVYITHTLDSIEQVIQYFGQGKTGWQDREQKLRYMEYRQKEGRLSAIVRFVYTDGESDGIKHHLVWVIAESSLPYPAPVEVNTVEPLIFSSDDTDLIKLGTLAFDTYMAYRMSEKTPVIERIASYKLKDISVLAGDINEFCVSLVYDITTDSDSYLNPALGAKGKGTWPDNYLEIRVKYAYEDVYSIKGIGTGGGGQGLAPYTGGTVLETASPKLSLEQDVGADMVELDYASEDIVIFHGYFGLFVYDLPSKKIVRSLDLKPIGCSATQGDDYCEVTVSADGNTVQLHPVSSKNMYVYTVSDNTLRQTAYKRMENRFADFVDIVDVVGYQKAGSHSHTAVKFDTGGYGYLHTTDWTLGTLTYVRGGDMLYRLFGFDESSSASAG